MKITNCLFCKKSLFKLALILLLAQFSFSLFKSHVNAQDQAEIVTTSPIYQLRVYEIFEHNKLAFHSRFRDHAARIMRNYGFDIVAMWESKYGGRTMFIYIVRWPDVATMRKHWAEFTADKEWAAIKERTAAQYGNLVGDIQERIMYSLNYSPNKIH